MRRLLVASRGHLALRTIGSCRRVGFSPIAVVAVSDPQRAHVARADGCEHLEGFDQATTYDSVDAIVGAALRCNADVVHPGCGALAENPELPARLAASGIRFVGPASSALAEATDKARAVATARRLGIPVLPNAIGRAAIQRLVADIGPPLVVKPARGCLGKGVRVAASSTDVDHALAAYADHDDAVYAERYVHPLCIVGVSLAVDETGTVVPLGERESVRLAGSLKLVDATPVQSVPPEITACMRRDASRLVVALGLHNVVTVEFIVGHEGHFFLEVNPRLTGAYQMCEAVTGIDIVALQLEIEGGTALHPTENPIDTGVHCIEARLYVRHDDSRVGPPCDRLQILRLAPVPGVAYSCSIDESRPLVFDNIVVQILATADGRAEAARRIKDALEQSEVLGVEHHGEQIAESMRAIGRGNHRIGRSHAR
jgi:biotin carboxylase